MTYEEYLKRDEGWKELREVEDLLKAVRDGLASMRFAAVRLGWTVDEVSIAIYGKVVL